MPPSAPPAPPGGVYKVTVRTTFTLAGSVDTFDPAPFRTALLAQFPAAEEVVLTVTAVRRALGSMAEDVASSGHRRRLQSIAVGAKLIMPSATAASAASTSISSTPATTMSSSWFGGSVSVASVTAATVQSEVLIAPSPPPPTPPPPSCPPHSPPPTPPAEPPLPPSRPEFCDEANVTDIFDADGGFNEGVGCCPRWSLTNLQGMFFNETCLRTSVEIQLDKFPCPTYNTSRLMSIFQSGLHIESTVGSLCSIVALASIMQLGGIPAPLKNSPLSVFMWTLWMVMQVLQVFTIALALLLVIFSYIQMQLVLNPCMVSPNGFPSLACTTLKECHHQFLLRRNLLASHSPPGGRAVWNETAQRCRFSLLHFPTNRPIEAPRTHALLPRTTRRPTHLADGAKHSNDGE
jgi:hypothetical protein